MCACVHVHDCACECVCVYVDMIGHMGMCGNVCVRALWCDMCMCAYVHVYMMCCEAH